MVSRLSHWRVRNSIAPETIAKLCGFSVDDLAQYETGGQVPEADALALLILFNDELTMGELLGAKTAGDDAPILARMDRAFRTSCLRWTRRSA